MYGGQEGPTPFNRRKEGVCLHLVQFELDASGSMKDEIPNLIDSMNTIAIPAFQGVSNSTTARNGLRIGCDLFSETIIPAWKGMLVPNKLSPQQLCVHNFQRSGLNGNTNLYQAILHGIEQLGKLAAYYQRITSEQGTNVWPRLLVFTDGADTSGHPELAEDIIKYLSGRQDPGAYQTVLVYFETGYGLSKDKFEALSKRLRFQRYWYFGNDQPIEERRRTFRHELRLFSSRTTASNK